MSTLTAIWDLMYETFDISKAGDGVFEAAEAGGFYAIGVDSDQKYINDAVIICSMKKEVGTSIYDAISRMLFVHRGIHPLMIVVQFYRDVDGVLGERHQEDVFKRLSGMFCLIGSQPLLKEGGEGVAVDDAVALGIAHNDLSVSFQRNVSQSLAFAVPSGNDAQLIDVDVLTGGVA